jgi:glycyl-tRNA synthetase beta chain
MASGLPTGQADTEEVLNGPPKSAGQGAAQGFARKNGATADQLETLVTPKGEYFALRRKVAGQATSKILAAKLPEFILGIPWPKAMYWGAKGSPRFIRPIRWIVALLQDDVVSFDAAGVASGNLTQGHRTAAGREAGQQKIAVTIATYEDALRSAHVLVRAAERRNRITQGCADLLAGKDLVVKPDAGLVETLTFITEWPTPILGSFAEEYLTLPAEVLVTVMRHHQKYFSVERPDGSLAPHFIAVMNSAADPDGWIQSGNQRVLRARFNDARFFWEMDQHAPLKDRVQSLANVTFQAKLGSYLDKTNRVKALVRELGGNENAERAALLAKTDLTTEMVKEFTELQGVVGGLYSRAQGEPEEVALAVYDHYKPVSMEGEIPKTVSGQIVSLADKLDTLRECFRIGMVPSGSKDPFALRRAAQGVLRILAEGEINASLAELCAGDATLIEFFADRVRYYFREIRGYRYDEVNAAMAAGWNDVKDLTARLEALKSVRGGENFEPLAASFKRVGNILTQAGFTGGAIDAGLLSDDAERDLYRAMTSLDLSGVSYQTALERIASLRPHVDFFFDKVLVNAPDPAVRSNRLALLYYLRSEFSRIADFSEITTN